MLCAVAATGAGSGIGTQVTRLSSDFLPSPARNIRLQQAVIRPKSKLRLISIRMEAGVPTKSGDEKHVVVCGAGVIGACTAYYLSQKGFQVTIVERTGVACASSGKAGGFLALDWSRGALGQLSRASFHLHAKLASELGVDYGYRKVDTLSVYVSESSGSAKAKQRRFKGVSLPGWVDGDVEEASVIGNQSSTAQVHPRLFTNAVLEAALKTNKVRLVMGEVTDVKVEETEGQKRVKEVILKEGCLEADAVVIAMGPWSSRNPLIKQLAEISGLKAHSVVLRPSEASAITAHPLFLQYRTLEGRAMEPEVYPRPDGEVYICGMSEEVPVPEDPAEVQPTPGSCSVLLRVAGNVSSRLVGGEVAAEQACFLPCSPDGLPLIGAIPNVAGAFVGTGHSCWGILNAPATGLALAELIADGVPSVVSLNAFDPMRFLR